MNDLENIFDIKVNPTCDEIFTHLCYIHEKLTQFSIKHWIIYGTLLGSIREQDIISYDYDFDLGILYEDCEKVLQLNEYINSDGYSLEKTTGTLYLKAHKFRKSTTLWRVSLKLKFNDDPVGDLYIYTHFDDGFVRRYDPKEKILFWPNSTLPSYFVDNLSESEIRGKKFPSPVHGEVLLEHFYGPMWKTPIKALSQNGESHPDYDYYGSYKYSSLDFLIKFLFESYQIVLSPNMQKDDIDYLFPIDHLNWLKENEKISF